MSGPAPFRLAQGGAIDRAKDVDFTFDGKRFRGHPGDTLASALLANGVRLLGRSFKYHRPRGLLAAGPEEPNALVEIGTGARREPNARASIVELYAGLEARSQNRFPSLRFDVLAANSLAGPLLAAGFYYKTFMWPKSFWEKLYEPLIRRAAGLGRASGLPDPDHYERASAHCDVLVIGAGPAGLMAALIAGRTGARVILVEQDFLLGGRLLDGRATIDGLCAAQWLEGIEAELASLKEVRILRRTSLFGSYDQKAFVAVERVSDHLAFPDSDLPRQRAWRIFAKRIVLAAGSLERPLVFGDNDRPGVMLAGAVRSFVNRFAVLPGRRAVLFAGHDEAAATARDLADAGASVLAIVDPRPQSSLAMQEAAKAVGAPLFAGSVVTQAIGGAGGVRAVRLSGEKAPAKLECDLVAMSGGWNPTLHLASHLGHKPVWNPQISAFVMDQLPEGIRVAGAAAGQFTLPEAFAAGAALGLEAAEATGFSGHRADLPKTEPEPASGMPLWRVCGEKGIGLRGKAFVDFQNDVTVADLELAEREGFGAIEHMKRYTTLGMATDQGKTANVTGIALMAELRQADIAKMSPTTFRPPFTPVAIGALAGHARGKHFRPTRLTPSHDWARARNATFMEAGAWLRPAFFPIEPGETWLPAALREARAVRAAVGVCDVSTLGKIALQGADAGRFLDYVYCNTISTLAIGKVRYGLMLREDGFVLDDGTVTRWGEADWLLTTTTANAGKVMQHLEFCAQVIWPHLDVQFASVSEQWAQLSLAGPRARALLQKIADPGFDLSNAGLPYMGAAEITLCGGVAARLYRISFSGELAYEIAVPSRYGVALMAVLIEAGREFSISPYGLEALNMLRIEKGHATGNELNGQTTARDLGLARMMSTKKDYIGRALAQRPALCDPARPILVGVKPVDPGQRFAAGAHFIEVGVKPSLEADLGHLTSATISPVFGHSIGLGLISNGLERMGGQLVAHDPVRGRDTLVEVCAPIFYDPEGARLRG